MFWQFLLVWVGIGGLIGAIVTPTVFKNMGLNPQTGIIVGLITGAIGNLIGLFVLWAYVPTLNPALESPGPFAGFTPVEKQVDPTKLQYNLQVFSAPKFRNDEAAGKIKLKVNEVSLSFGGIKALQNVDFDVEEGQIFAVIGPNGAGKTSLINSINGFYRPQVGSVIFEGQNVTDLPPYKRAQLGISRTFQNIALYTNMTALDNLMAARHIHMRSNIVTGAMFYGPTRAEEVYHRERVEEIIDFLEMENVRKTIVGNLSYGLRKRVELGRALALEPSLLLLDEPMAGMNVEEKEDMARFILDIHERQGMTIMLIEHDVGLVMDISHRIVALDFGQKIAEGTPAQIRQNEVVVHAYLGQEE
jgi:branched-chain amino acid transport system ATP-binding protein